MFKNLKKTSAKAHNIDKALTDFLAIIAKVPVKKIKVAAKDSTNFIMAKSIFAKNSSPQFNASAMDGIAVISKKTQQATKEQPLTLKLNQDFIFVNTGNPIIPPYDAVIMKEDILKVNESTLKITHPAKTWQYIRPIGDDIKAQQMILPIMHQIRPLDIAAIRNSGHNKVLVYEPIKVGILPTGDEIVEQYDLQDSSKILDSNTWTIKAALEKYGALATRYDTVKDDLLSIKNKLLQLAQENHFIITNAGSSIGSKDFIAQSISELGQIFARGLSIAPGRPAMLGIIGNTPIIALPGYPVAAYTAFEEIVLPVLQILQKKNLPQKQALKAVISDDIESSPNNRESIRVKLAKVNNNYIAYPLKRKSSLTTTLAEADGTLIMPLDIAKIKAGSKINILLEKPQPALNKDILVAGIYDSSIDIINSLALEHYNCGFTFAPILAKNNNQKAIINLEKNWSHIAPLVLLDKISNTYNISYLKKHFKNNPEKYCLIKGPGRALGILTNNKNQNIFNSIRDLANNKARIGNLAPNSSAYQLIDHIINSENIDSNNILGYDNIFPNFMALGHAIKKDFIDAGFGYYNIAKTYDLAFNFIAYEEYDFLVKASFLELDGLKNFIQILKSSIFQQKLNQFSKYKFDNIGEIIKLN